MKLKYTMIHATYSFCTTEYVRHGMLKNMARATYFKVLI